MLRVAGGGLEEEAIRSPRGIVTVLCAVGWAGWMVWRTA